MAVSLAAVAAMTFAPDDVYFPLGKFRGFDNSPLTIGNATTSTLEGRVNEDVTLFRMEADHSDSFQNCAIAGFLLPEGQNGIYGYMPASVFSADSQNNPAIGLYYPGNTKAAVDFRNDSGGAVTACVGFSQTSSSEAFSGYNTGRKSQVFCLGSDTASGEALNVGAETEIVFSPQEYLVLDRLIIQAQALDDLSVSSILIGTRELVPGGDIPAGMFAAENPDNPTLSPTDVVVLPGGKEAVEVYYGKPIVVGQNIKCSVTIREQAGFAQTIRTGFTTK